MHIMFMGTPEFALPSLKILLDNQYQICAVVTAPDKPRGRGQQVSSSAMKEFALKQGLQILQPVQLNDPKFITTVTQLHPDIIVVVAFRILPREIYTIPRLGAFNLHASLLPRYRGAAPINWAIIKGEKETGVTTFYLQDKVDTGAMILQARVSIGVDETAGELHDKLAEVGAEIVLQTVRLIELGKAQERVQDESLASPAPKIFKDDCRIEWSTSSVQIHNLVRGLSPYPAAWTTHQNKTIKIYRTKLQSLSDDVESQRKPGEVVCVEKNLLSVRTGDGAVSILEVQQEGKNRLGVADFLRGYKIAAGERLS